MYSHTPLSVYVKRIREIGEKVGDDTYIITRSQVMQIFGSSEIAITQLVLMSKLGISVKIK